MINHYLLVFEKKNGKATDVDWIHKDDLEPINYNNDDN